MTNFEIRQKALSKVKVKKLTAMAVISYAVGWTAQFFGDLTGKKWLDLAIYLAVSFAYSLVVRAGLARVALTAWRHGEAKFGEYFAYLRNPKLLKRAAPLGGMVVLLALARLYAPALPEVVSLAAQCVLLLVDLLLYVLYFAIELYADRPVRRGLAQAFANLGRIIRMEFAIGWWIALVFVAAFALAGYAAGLSGIALGLVMTLVTLGLTWLVGAYVLLVNAGLARDLFRE